MADCLLRQRPWKLAQVPTPHLFESPSMSEPTHSLASILLTIATSQVYRLLNRETLQLSLLVAKICRLLGQHLAPRLDGETS